MFRYRALRSVLNSKQSKLRSFKSGHLLLDYITGVTHSGSEPVLVNLRLAYNKILSNSANSRWDDRPDEGLSTLRRCIFEILCSRMCFMFLYTVMAKTFFHCFHHSEGTALRFGHRKWRNARQSLR